MPDPKIDHLKTLRELVALPEGYPVAFVEHALRARPALAALLRVVEAAKAAEFELHPWVRDEETKHGREFRGGKALRALDAALSDLAPEVEDGE